jgi:hypothetical protein
MTDFCKDGQKERKSTILAIFNSFFGRDLSGGTGG